MRQDDPRAAGAASAKSTIGRAQVHENPELRL